MSKCITRGQKLAGMSLSAHHKMTVFLIKRNWSWFIIRIGFKKQGEFRIDWVLPKQFLDPSLYFRACRLTTGCHSVSNEVTSFTPQ